MWSPNADQIHSGGGMCSPSGYSWGTFILLMEAVSSMEKNAENNHTDLLQTAMQLNRVTHCEIPAIFTGK